MPASSQLPSQERLLDLIDAMAGQPVLVLADLVLDRFVSGSPKRISREAPVLILSYEGETLAPGGGANAVANVVALGGKPLPVGVVGDDDNGRQLLSALAERGVSIQGIAAIDGYRTPTKTRILGGGRHSIKQQIVRYDIEDVADLSHQDVSRLTERLQQFDGTARVAIMSDYGYGVVSPALMQVVRAALDEDSLVVCDSRYRLGEFLGADGATPNEEEAEQLFGAPLKESAADLARQGQDWLAQTPGQFLLVTRGSQGMVLIDQRGACRIPVYGSAQVADVTGAGDTVIGTFALTLAAGGTALEAALLANYAGGIVVMKAGTATLTREELRQAVHSDPGPLEAAQWVDT